MLAGGVVAGVALRRCGGWGCGSGLIEFFGADDVKSGGGGGADGSGERETGEGWHDVCIGGCGLFGFAEQEADAGAVDAGGVGAGGLGDDDAGVSGCGDVGDGAEFEPEAADVDGGGAFALTDEVGDGDLLRAEALGDANGPLAAYGDAGGGGLREDVSGRRVGGVEAVFEIEDEAVGAGLLAGFERVRPVRSGTLTSRPWMARRMEMKAETSATTSIARAPRTMLKKRLMLRVFSLASAHAGSGYR